MRIVRGEKAQTFIGNYKMLKPSFRICYARAGNDVKAVVSRLFRNQRKNSSGKNAVFVINYNNSVAKLSECFVKKGYARLLIFPLPFAFLLPNSRNASLLAKSSVFCFSRQSAAIRLLSFSRAA